MSAICEHGLYSNGKKIHLTETKKTRGQKNYFDDDKTKPFGNFFLPDNEQTNPWSAINTQRQEMELSHFRRHRGLLHLFCHRQF